MYRVRQYKLLLIMIVIVFATGVVWSGASAGTPSRDVFAYEVLGLAEPAAGGNALIVNGASFYETDGWRLEDVENEINDLLAAGVDVAVRGGWLGIADYSFYFYIPEGVTLIWAANISGANQDDDFVSILPPWDEETGGCFVLAGGTVEYYGPKACVYSADVELIVESGVIAAYGEGCRALYHQAGDISLKGGEIHAEGDLSKGISFWDRADAFRIDGCTITATGNDSYAVYFEGGDAGQDSTYKFVSGKIVGAANINDYIGEMLYAIDGWDGGGNGALAAAANLVKDTVTVTGAVNGASYGLDLNIPAGVTVVWDAEASSAADFEAEDPNGDDVAPGFGLVNLTGAGTFVVSPTGTLTVEGGAANAIYAEGAAVAVRGTVKYKGDADRRGAAVNGASRVVLDGGSISAEGEGSNAVFFPPKGEFNYLSGEIRGALAPYPGMPYADFESKYGLSRREAGKQLTVNLPALPVGVGAAYEDIRVYPRGAENGFPSLVDPESVNISGATLRFATTAQLPPGFTGADIIDLTVSSYFYRDYHIRIEVGLTPDDLLPPHRTPSAQIDFATERLTGLEPGVGYAVTVSDPAGSGGRGKAGQMAATADANGSIPIEPAWFGQSILIVKSGDRWGNSDSSGQLLNIPARPGIAGLGGVKGGAGMLVGLNYLMEYKLNSAKGWAAATGNSVSGLPAGMYHVRLRATATEFAGEVSQVEIGSDLTTSGGAAIQDAGGSGGANDSADPDPDAVVAPEAPRQVTPQPAEPWRATPQQEEPQTVEPQQEEPQPATPQQEQNPGLFFDVKPDDWFYGDVKYVYENGLMSGVEAGIFDPEGTINYATLLTVLYRMDGEPDVSGLDYAYSDVYRGAWYGDAVKWAAVNGIMSGFEDGIFSPADIIVTREWLATTFTRYMAYAGINPLLNDEYRVFADEGQISDFAKGAVQTMNKLDVLRGGGEQKINPKSIANRAEFAAMLHRFAELNK